MTGGGGEVVIALRARSSPAIYVEAMSACFKLLIRGNLLSGVECKAIAN